MTSDDLDDGFDTVPELTQTAIALRSGNVEAAAFDTLSAAALLLAEMRIPTADACDVLTQHMEMYTLVIETDGRMQ